MTIRGPRPFHPPSEPNPSDAYVWCRDLEKVSIMKIVFSLLRKQFPSHYICMWEGQDGSDSASNNVSKSNNKFKFTDLKQIQAQQWPMHCPKLYKISFLTIQKRN